MNLPLFAKTFITVYIHNLNIPFFGFTINRYSSLDLQIHGQIVTLVFNKLR